jgi:3,4-dihydroxy 2-butanone 4-phosphate synthase
MNSNGNAGTALPPEIRDAVESLRNGKFVCIYDADGREEETDLVMAAQYCSWEDVRRLRLDGGGLIFLMVHARISDKLGLPFLADLYYKEGGRWPVLKELIPNDIPYDAKSSFSITVNHRKTFTGITDRDRALTISEFARISEEINGQEITTEKAQRMLGARFRAPGHIPICASSHEVLASRKGHTELSVALMRMAGLTPVAVGAEMMGNSEGNALSKEDARAYAEENGFVSLDGEQIIEAWRSWLE